MYRTLLVKILFSFTVLFESCDFEGKYVHPCAGQYGSKQILDSIKKRYKLTGAVYFAEWHKDYLAPKRNSCDTIHLSITSDNISFIYTDTFAISIAKIFFNDSSNIRVKVLNLQLENLWPSIGTLNVNYDIDKNFLQNSYRPNDLVDIDDMRFNIEQENPYTQYSESEQDKGMTVVVKVKEDYKNFEKLASQIKSQYSTTIKNKQLSQFSIDIIVELPTCKLCSGKKYHFFYDKRNKNI